jgi:nitroimidazol reductase NimA-like FMN-containing flavoprotein (pyridoxamine 5'-phosphate oxidase superfamily)
MARLEFDIDLFLARPLVARLATTRPAVRPVWYVWEEGRFWILTGPWNRIPGDVAADPRVAVVVDTCDLQTGECLQVVARGHGELVPYDRERGRRKLERYLGPDHSAWDTRFRRYLSDAPEARWLMIAPTSLTATDLSFAPSRSETRRDPN